MTKNTATVTWVTYHNYGTLLQAYALQQYILSLGYSNMILDDSAMIAAQPAWKRVARRLYHSLAGGRQRQFYRAKRESDLLFEKFKDEHLLIDKDTADLPSLDGKYDLFICGSDQIWNPYWLGSRNGAYFYAPFTKNRKIAYAPSIGVAQVPVCYQGAMRSLLQGFDRLSAREPEGVEALGRISGKSVELVADPTLLLTKEQWSALLPCGNGGNGKFVLGYFLTPNPTYISAAIEYARLKACPLRMVFTDKAYARCGCGLVTCGPLEFLGNINEAECLFTDSFHGSIFASIFHTQFFTFRRFRQGATSQNTRVENLLGMMGLPERLLGEDGCDAAGMAEMADIDFGEVGRRQAPLIEKSRIYLKDALE